MADTHTHTRTHTQCVCAAHANMGNKQGKGKGKGKQKGGDDYGPCNNMYLLVYKIRTLSFMCAEDDIAVAASSSKYKAEKGEKMDENFEKDALRLLDKNVKRDVKKVRSALIAVPVQILQTTA